MYIKKQINKVLDIYNSYTYIDNIIQELNKILDKKTLTKSDRLRFNELIKLLYSDTLEV